MGLFLNPFRALSYLRQRFPFGHFYGETIRPFADLLQRLEDPDLGFVPNRRQFGPTTVEIRDIQGLRVVAASQTPLMPHQVHLHKPWTGLVPVREGADRHLMP